MAEKLRTGCDRRFGAIGALVRDDSGGVMIEYCLIVALIALSQMTVLSTVGTSLSETFSRVAAAL